MRTLPRLPGEEPYDYGRRCGLAHAKPSDLAGNPHVTKGLRAGRAALRGHGETLRSKLVGRVLAMPDLRERRAEIQRLYGEAAEAARRARGYQRMAAGSGHDRHQSLADRIAAAAVETEAAWREASRAYETERARRLAALGLSDC